jgi:hypothetical protein
MFRITNLNKWKIAFITLLIVCVSFLAGCIASAKLDIPNLGILQPISWQAIDDPMYGGGYINQFIFTDTERNNDYIVIHSHYGTSITPRLK